MSSQKLPLSSDYALSALKGAPLAVLLALWRDGPAGRKDLIERTGWKKDAVGAALKELVWLELVERHSYRQWGVAQGVSVPQLLGDGNGQGAEERGERVSGSADRDGERRQDRPPAAAATSGEEREKRPARAERQGNDAAAVKAAQPLTGGERKTRLSRHEERAHRRWRKGDETADGPEVRPAPREKKGSSGQAGEEVFGELSQESVSHTRARHDHDLNDPPSDPDLNEKNNNDHDREQVAIIQSLRALNPPFDHAEAWLRTVSPGLVSRWLAYLEAMPAAQRALLRNEAAFLRSSVNKGQEPPPPRKPKPDPRPGVRAFFEEMREKERQEELARERWEEERAERARKYASDSF